MGVRKELWMVLATVLVFAVVVALVKPPLWLRPYMERLHGVPIDDVVVSQDDAGLVPETLPDLVGEGGVGRPVDWAIQPDGSVLVWLRDTSGADVIARWEVDGDVTQVRRFDPAENVVAFASDGATTVVAVADGAGVRFESVDGAALSGAARVAHVPGSMQVGDGFVVYQVAGEADLRWASLTADASGAFGLESSRYIVKVDQCGPAPWTDLYVSQWSDEGREGRTHKIGVVDGEPMLEESSSSDDTRRMEGVCDGIVAESDLGPPGVNLAAKSVDLALWYGAEEVSEGWWLTQGTTYSGPKVYLVALDRDDQRAITLDIDPVGFAVVGDIVVAAIGDIDGDPTLVRYDLGGVSDGGPLPARAPVARPDVLTVEEAGAVPTNLLVPAGADAAGSFVLLADETPVGVGLNADSWAVYAWDDAAAPRQIAAWDHASFVQVATNGRDLAVRVERDGKVWIEVLSPEGALLGTWEDPPGAGVMLLGDTLFATTLLGHETTWRSVDGSRSGVLDVGLNTFTLVDTCGAVPWKAAIPLVMLDPDKEPDPREMRVVAPVGEEPVGARQESLVGDLLRGACNGRPTESDMERTGVVFVDGFDGAISWVAASEQWFVVAACLEGGPCGPSEVTAVSRTGGPAISLHPQGQEYASIIVGSTALVYPEEPAPGVAAIVYQLP